MSKWGNKEGFEAFFNEKIILQKDTSIRANLLFDEYESYCSRNKFNPVTYGTFLNEFKKKNIEVRREGTNGTYNYIYIHDIFYCNNGVKVEKEISQAIPTSDISNVIQRAMFKNSNPRDMNTIANRANFSFSPSRTKELQEKLLKDQEPAKVSNQTTAINQPIKPKEEKFVENAKKVEEKSVVQPQQSTSQEVKKTTPVNQQTSINPTVGSGLIDKIIDTTIKLQIDQANLNYYLSMYKVEQIKNIKKSFGENKIEEADILSKINSILGNK